MCTFLLISIPGYALASSKSPYESGYDHGCDDAGISDPSERYINQPEKGPAYHTSQFMNGYDSGFSSCSSYSNNYNNDNYNDLPQSDRKTEVNCNEAGFAGGLIGGGLGGLVAGPTGAIEGYAAGSSMLKGVCENNNR